jgi:hypothetical protein
VAEAGCLKQSVQQESDRLRGRRFEEKEEPGHRPLKREKQEQQKVDRLDLSRDREKLKTRVIKQELEVTVEAPRRSSKEEDMNHIGQARDAPVLPESHTTGETPPDQRTGEGRRPRNLRQLKRVRYHR